MNIASLMMAFVATTKKNYINIGRGKWLINLLLVRHAPYSYHSSFQTVPIHQRFVAMIYKYKLISITTILLATCSMNVLSALWPFSEGSQVISSNDILIYPDGVILQEMPVEWLPITGGDFSFSFADVVGSGTITEVFSSGTYTTTVNTNNSSQTQTVDWSIDANQLGIHGIIEFDITTFDFFVVWDIVNNGSLTEYIATDMDGDGLRGFQFLNGPFVGFNYALDVTLASVPIPTAFWLFGSGIIGLIGIARRKSVMIKR